MTAATTDEAMQLAVLTHLLALHPVRLSPGELLREMWADRPTFAQRDACDRAVGDLLATGLLRRDGDSVVPTRAALVFDSLAGS